jgi:hypothetical protein
VVNPEASEPSWTSVAMKEQRAPRGGPVVAR